MGLVEKSFRKRFRWCRYAIFKNMSNKELAEELHKPIIKKFKKIKLKSLFIDNIWGTDFADMQLTSIFNKGTRFLLCVIDIFSK